MGVSLCTGPIVKEELKAIILMGMEGGVHGNSSIFSALQDSTTLEYPSGEEYKVSASVQHLLILLRLVVHS